MKRSGAGKKRTKKILLTLGGLFFVFILFIFLFLAVFDGSKVGNVALIPVTGEITVDGLKSFGQKTASSAEIVQYIHEANDNEQIKVILLEINSPGGSAVASDEIASVVRRSEKPVVSLIREVGASGGYWVASASDHIIANRMSITGSIGVVSSYLEFSGLMEEYGIGYERLVAGEKKDMGVPFRKLSDDEKAVLQKKITRIHDFFIKEIAQNRKMQESEVRKLSTGEFFLGVEALELGLIDQLGDKDTAESYIKDNYGIDKITYAFYQKEAGLLDLLYGVLADFSFSIGQGFGSIFLKGGNKLMLV